LLHDGLEDRIFRAAPGRWQLWRCASCRCAYLDPRPTRESIASAYATYFPRATADAGNESAAGWRAALWNGYLNRRYGYSFRPAARAGALILPLFPKRRWHAESTVRGLAKPRQPARLLDVGFGDASFLRAMQRAGWEVAGLEPDPAAVGAARETGLHVEQGSLEEAPFEPRSFDAITLSHVVEHLHDPVSSLRACLELLRPRGVLWVATPNLEGRGHQRFGRDWFGLDPPRHLVLFTRRGLERALEGLMRPARQAA
jgi:SAM-dependent methyltransferase